LTNGQIIDILETTASLMELHDENPFKIRAVQNAVFNLDKVSAPLWEMKLEELEKLEGIGKGIAAKIHEINSTGTTQEYQFYISSTPPGVIDMLGIKGIGPKKVRLLWKEVEIDSLEKLQKACIDQKISSVKGFGEKTQESILKSLEFILNNKGKFLYSDIEGFALQLETKLKELELSPMLSLSGDIRRKMETVAFVQVLIGSDEREKVMEILDNFPWLEKNEITSGPFAWRGNDKVLNASVEIKIYPKSDYVSQLFLHSSGSTHLQTEAKEGKTFFHYVKKNSFLEEKEIYESLGMQYIVPELREGYKEVALAKENKLPILIEESDLKGILHNHSTYSDGKNTLEEMAQYCKDLGYQYLGITDHSKTATYANGLQEFRVKKQQEEIELLNKKLAPFKIFKGIESDILVDGSLDYSDEILKSFDFIVASIHSGFNMDIEKATNRLITAIENPYTTILGHVTGRILLKREGYPVDHKRIIDACADNKVIIEINSNPHRLDIDWRWVDYALSKGVLLALNPDAHVKDGYHDMKYGVYVGRKGGLTADMTFNAWPLEKVEEWFKAKKK
jgi:DNA polymerase (family 10)